MATYIWSDLHLNHDKIRLYENRPFNSESEMNKAICKAWRDTIKSEDIIINLGDVSWRLSKEWMEKTIKNLPGYKILIMGNHDRKKSIQWWIDVGFNEVYKYPIIYDGFYILSHESIYINQYMPYVNVHGHTHSEKSTNSQKFNVSIELIGYKPMLFDNIKKFYTVINDES